MPQALRTPLFLALASLTAADIAAAPVMRMVLTADAQQGVKTVSFVKNPAIEKGWVTLSAVELAPSAPKRYHLSAETTGPEAQVLTGPALIPGQKILRLNAEKKPFHILFEAEEIQAIARRFAAEGNHNNSNQDHATALSGNVFYESWIVTDPANDKAAALGIDVPAGTWMLSAHIPDADFWETEVKSGNITGFSIEGLFDQEALTMAAVPAPTTVKMKKTFFQRLSAAGLALLGLSAVALKDGNKVDVAEDGTVSELDADGNISGPAKDGSYELEDGSTLEVKDGKKVVALADEQPTDNAGAPDTTKVVEALTAAATETDAAKLVAAITAAITALGGTAPTVDTTKLSAVEVKLEGISMADGTVFNYNPITRVLTKADGSMVMTGVYACQDGSYFKVSTDQYTYQIDAATYADATKLSAVQLELSAAQQQLSTTSGSTKLLLNAEPEITGAGNEQSHGIPVALSRTAELRARQAGS